MTNWASYEAGLRRHGSLALWVSDAAIAAWRAAPRTTLGGQARYSQTTIETALMVRLVFHQPLRQTEGLLGSLLDLLGVDLPVPDHTTISRRAARRTPVLATVLPVGPVTLVIDSPGIKVYGAGEWHRDTVMADGAYDVEPVYQTIAARAAGAKVVIPPCATAVVSETAETVPSQRDRHIQSLAEHGRLGWQRQTTFGQGRRRKPRWRATSAFLATSFMPARCLTSRPKPPSVSSS